MIGTNYELAAALKDIADNYKTLYVMGCFGAPMNAANKKRYCNNHAYNRRGDRTEMILAASGDTFGFDCVCLIKGVLWGWCGDTGQNYGGAKYASNGVPDINADTMIKKCRDVSTDFCRLEVGEAVWLPGHIGVYIGNGLAVECTPSFRNCVQITAVQNMGRISGYSARKWSKHGRLPYICYINNGEDTTGMPSDSPLTPSSPCHVVKRGDTLYAIAKKYDTTVDRLLEKNRENYPKIKADYIVSGWKLTL